jgi:hypothetical protein
MKALDVGPLPVCGDNDRLVGMTNLCPVTPEKVAHKGEWSD